jgi:hypothetical protein
MILLLRLVCKSAKKHSMLDRSICNKMYVALPEQGLSLITNYSSTALSLSQH